MLATHHLKNDHDRNTDNVAPYAPAGAKSLKMMIKTKNRFSDI